MKKYLSLFALVAAVGVSPAFAQGSSAISPAAMAATKQLLQATKTREMMELSVKQQVEAMPAQLKDLLWNMAEKDPALSADEKKEMLARFEQSMPAMVNSIRDVFSDPKLVDEMMDEFAPLYARLYTLNEIKQLTAFYRSPLGQKTVAVMPQLVAANVEISNRVMMPRLQKLMTELVQSASKKEM